MGSRSGKKAPDRNAEGVRDLLQPAGGHSRVVALVPRDLALRQAEALRELLLRPALARALLPNPGADAGPLVRGCSHVLRILQPPPPKVKL